MAAVRAVEVVATGSYTTRCVLIGWICLRCWVEAKVLASTIPMAATVTTISTDAATEARSHFWIGVHPTHSTSSKADCHHLLEGPTTNSFAAYWANSCPARPFAQRSSTYVATESNLLAA